ncbi:maleylpyruvate isomerase family mycothiol-dependent enzyme [Nocardia iowensis]|nr:maleylpyruvate isomerase family mycothiol-dependent enzyme [Nocardia iowensis]
MDVRGMLAEERAELISLLRTLSDEEWAAPSLCRGWRVRDVVGHLLYDTIALPTYGAIAARSGFSIDGLNGRLVEKAKALPTTVLVDKLEAEAGRIAKYAPRLILADVMVHQQDIRRPLGRTRTIPADRLTTVLDHPDPFALPWRRTKGLRFVATDVSWSKGSGPEVRGPGEAIALAVVGRAVAVDELAGDGVAELRRRCA